MSRTATSTRTEPKDTLVLTATVLRRHRLSPSFVRLTLAGGGLECFEHRGYDQWFRLFLPREGRERMSLPVAPADPHWYSHYLAAPEERRVWMRYVTVSAYRPRGVEGPELDVDVVVHGEPGGSDSGPLATWAQTVRPGEGVGLLDQGVIFRPDLAATDVMLIGDETALPAVAGILRSLQPGTRGHALLEVPHPEDVRPLAGPDGVAIAWLPRHGVSTVPGQLLLDEVRRSLRETQRETQRVTPRETQRVTHRVTPRGTLPGDGAPPDRRPYVYGAGESRMASALGHALRQEFGWPKDRVTTVGYWHYAGEGHAT